VWQDVGGKREERGGGRGASVTSVLAAMTRVVRLLSEEKQTMLHWRCPKVPSCIFKSSHKAGLGLDGAGAAQGTRVSQRPLRRGRNHC